MSAYSELMIDLAVEESAAGRFASAAALLRSILGASGRDAFVLYGIGHMEHRRGNHAEAVRLLRQSIAMEPHNAKAHNDLGLALFALGEQQAGYAALLRAWTMDEELALAVMTEGIDLLRRGDLVAGWLKYEARLIVRPGVKPRREFSEPRWLGDETLAGKTILLHCEQGYGDAIQFVRYVPRVAALGATVLLEGHPALMPLFREISGVTATFALNQALPRFDMQCPVMSLPLALRTGLAGIPADVPYLRPSPDLVRRWAARLGQGERLRVGLAWSGNPENEADQERSISLAALAPLLSVPGCEFHVIQTDIRPADRALLDRLPDVRDHSAAPRELIDFRGTAALLSLLDLIVSVDTSLAHLAGALARPAWVMLPALPDWRWLMGRDDSPWYPTIRLFRQRTAGDWTGVVAEVAGQLSSRSIGSR